jgi:hypothetical protein
MDTSYHAILCDDGPELCALRHYDNKTLHTVPCSCPCGQYEINNKKGKCSFCWHYHDPADEIGSNVRDFKYFDEEMNSLIGKSTGGICL